MSEGYEGKIPTPKGYVSGSVGNAEQMRLDRMVSDVVDFYIEGIQEVITQIADELKTELEQTAPYDRQEIDNYHMTEHMTDSPIKNGREVESEAAYSGHLEYGTAYHGVQYIFFRPATEKAWYNLKKKAIKEMTEIFTK